MRFDWTLLVGIPIAAFVGVILYSFTHEEGKIRDGNNRWLLCITTTYALSLIFIGIYSTPSHKDGMTGWMILLTGWTGILALSFAWYANAWFWAGLRAYRQGEFSTARTYSLIACGVALTAFFPIHPDLFVPNPTAEPTDLGPSFHLWFASIAAFTVLSYAQLQKKRAASSKDRGKPLFWAPQSDKDH